MADAHANFAYSTIATAPSPAASGTSLVVGSGDGTLFPAVPFNATVWPDGERPSVTNAEIVRVTGISTDTFTITRTQEGTSARTIVVGDQIAATITAKTLTDVELWDNIIRKPSDETVNGSSTLQNDNDLIVPITADVPTLFKAVIYYTSNATPDFKHDFALSTGTVTQAWRQHIGLGPTTAVIQASQVADLSTTIINAGAGGSALVVRIEGYVHGSATANMIFRWAQNTSDASDTVVKAGSYIAYRALD